MTDETKLPHSEEAERNVISCVLLDGAPALVKALDVRIKEDWFFIPRNAKLWRAILWNHNHGLPVETHVVVEELRKAKKLDQIGVDHIIEASKAMPTTAAFEHWLNCLRDAWTLREMIKIADDVKAAAYNYQGSPEAFVTAVSSALSIREETHKQETLQDVTQGVIDVAEAILRGERKIETTEGVIEWPWPDMNRRFKPIRPGNLVTVAARPSVGKSSFVRQVVMAAAKKHPKKAILLFSAEMGQREVVECFAQSESGVCFSDLEMGTLPPDHVRRFIKAAQNDVYGLKNLFIHEDDTFGRVVAKIEATAQMRKIGLIAVDYLQIVDPGQDQRETRDAALGRMTRHFKQLARKHGCPLIILSQVNRDCERQNRPPTKSDLRECGSIENDSDRIMFIHPQENGIDGRPQDVRDDNIKDLLVSVIQDKGRGVGVGKMDMVFHRPTTTFKQYAR